jgi:hypothetical protein
MDTAAFHAHQVKSQMNRDNNATQLLNAMAQEKFLVQPQNATNARTAHKTLCQMLPEESVTDQFQFAHVLKDTLRVVMSAKNVELDKSLIQTTTRDVSQEFATKETKSSHRETSAGNAKPAQLVMSQTHPELNASESSQHAAALKSMTKVDMSALSAHHTKLLPTVTEDASQDNAQDSTKFLVLLISAMLVNNARKDLPLITSEEDAWDTLSLNAVAMRDSMTLDSDVLHAHQVPDHLLITDNA